MKFMNLISDKSCPVMSVKRFIKKKIVYEIYFCSCLSNIWIFSKGTCLIEKKYKKEPCLLEKKYKTFIIF